jgi:hypothetical protein
MSDPSFVTVHRTELRRLITAALEDATANPDVAGVAIIAASSAAAAPLLHCCIDAQRYAAVRRASAHGCCEMPVPEIRARRQTLVQVFQMTGPHRSKTLLCAAFGLSTCSLPSLDPHAGPLIESVVGCVTAPDTGKGRRALAGCWG